jgi:hypothetical protein
VFEFRAISLHQTICYVPSAISSAAEGTLSKKPLLSGGGLKAVSPELVAPSLRSGHNVRRCSASTPEHVPELKGDARPRGETVYRQDVHVNPGGSPSGTRVSCPSSSRSQWLSVASSENGRRCSANTPDPSPRIISRVMVVGRRCSANTPDPVPITREDTSIPTTTGNLEDSSIGGLMHLKHAAPISALSYVENALKANSAAQRNF